MKPLLAFQPRTNPSTKDLVQCQYQSRTLATKIEMFLCKLVNSNHPESTSFSHQRVVSRHNMKSVGTKICVGYSLSVPVRYFESLSYLNASSTSPLQHLLHLNLILILRLFD